MRRISQNVRILRAMLGISQTELGRRAGVSRSTIAKVEGRIVDPKMDTVIKLAKALRCSVADLIDEGCVDGRRI